MTRNTAVVGSRMLHVEAVGIQIASIVFDWKDGHEHAEDYDAV